MNQVAGENTSPKWLSKIIDDPDVPQNVKNDAMRRYDRELRTKKQTDNTEAAIEDWDGRPMFRIFKVDKNGRRAFKIEGGKKVDLAPLIGFGILKASAIYRHIAELKSFVEAHKDE